MNTIAKLQAVVGADISGLKSGMNEANGIIGGASKKFSQFGDGMMKLGTKLTAGLTLPIVGVGTKIAQSAGDFEAATNILGIAARSSGTAMDTLSEAAIRVGGDTRLVGIDAAQAADAMTNFYKAGMTTTDIFGDLDGYLAGNTELMGALRASIDLAAASDLDLAQASDIVAITMATFGLNAEDATGIANSFVGAADASVAEVSNLTDAMVNLGPTWSAFGWGLDDANTALAILSERGILGAEAGTALKSMLTNIMRPTDDVTETLAALGVALYDDAGKMRELPEIMADLEAGLAGVTEQQRNTAVQTLAGTYGMKAMQTLLAEGSDGWAEMERKLAEAATAQEIAKERTKGLNAAIQNLGGVAQTFMIVAGTPFIEKYLTPAAEGLTKMVEKLVTANPAMLDMGIKAGIALAAAGPLALGIGAVSKALGVLLSPVGLATLAIGGLAALVINANGGFETFKENLKTAFDEEGMKGVGLFLGEAFMNTLPTLVDAGEAGLAIGEKILDGVVLATANLAVKMGNWSLDFLHWAQSPEMTLWMQSVGLNLGRSVGEGIVALMGMEGTSQPIGVAIAKMMWNALGYVADALFNLGMQAADGFVKGIIEGLNVSTVAEMDAWAAQQSALPEDEQSLVYQRRNAPSPWQSFLDWWDKQGGNIKGGPGPEGYASGTSFAPSGWSLVGERGPELVNLNAGSQVMNAQDTEKALGNTVNIQPGAIVINVANGNARNVELGVRNALRQIGVPA